MKISKVFYGLVYAGIIGAGVYRMAKKVCIKPEPDDYRSQFNRLMEARREAKRTGSPVVTAEQLLKGGAGAEFMSSSILKVRFSDKTGFPKKSEPVTMIVGTPTIGKQILMEAMNGKTEPICNN